MGIQGSDLPVQSTQHKELTRKEFYDLALHLREYASQLASFDPRRVNLKQCHKFNDWLRNIRRYRQFAAPLADVTAARPIARWQLLVLWAVIWLGAYLGLMSRLDRIALLLFFNAAFLVFIALIFIPERAYGTTIEQIEGKTLRVVKEMESMLARAEIGLTEAAFFKAREALQGAHYELRQQLDLAHRD